MEATKESSAQLKGENGQKQNQQAKKKKLIPCAVPCLCWAAKVLSARLYQMPKEERPNKLSEEFCFKQFIHQRDQCEACQPETPRTKDKCTCNEAYLYFMGMCPPISRQVFPTQFQISCAQLDWIYERIRCLACQDRSAKKIEEDFAEMGKKKKELGHQGWTFVSGVPLKVTLKEVYDDDDVPKC